MTFGKAFIHAHREALAFMLACPLLALIPILAEFFQHWVEMGVGMYNGIEGAQAAETAPERMQAGFVKVLALSIMSYPVIRFVANGRDRAAARQLNPRAIALFVPVLLLGLAMTAIDLFALRENPAASLSLFGASLVFSPLLFRWYAGAPLGIWISPLRSVREMLPAWLWAFAFSVAAMLPLMLVHYGFGIWAIFAPEWLKWPIHIVDSIAVGLLVAVMASAQWIAARRPGPLEEGLVPGAQRHGTNSL